MTRKKKHRPEDEADSTRAAADAAAEALKTMVAEIWAAKDGH